MDNVKDFEDFEVEVVETQQPTTGEIKEESIGELSTEVQTEEISASEATEECVNEEQESNDEIPQLQEQSISTEFVEKLLKQLESLSSQNELLTKKFDEKIAQDEHKALLFDKMYNELQSYKTDLYAKLLKPFILSTITLLDDTNTFIGKLGENESALAEKYLRSMPEDLIDILESNGVILYEDEGEKFNPRTQRVVKQVPTENPDLDNYIAKRIRKGYNWNGVNLKPELVWIYKFKQELETKSENNQ